MLARWLGMTTMIVRKTKAQKARAAGRKAAKNANGNGNGNGNVKANVKQARKIVGNLPGRTRRNAGLVSKGLLPSGNMDVGTAVGLQYAMTALHPCNENFTNAVPYPDENRMPSHCTRMQRTFTFSPPGVKCDGNTAPSIDTCSWNLCIVTTPWPEYPWLMCATQGTNEPPMLAQYLISGKQILNGDRKNVTYSWDTWYYFAFPNFMDASRFGEIGADANDIRKKYQKLRVVAKGTTSYLNASRLYDGGRVICGQYPVATRFVDTFNPSKVAIDQDALLDLVIKRLCIQSGSGTTDPATIRALTDHTHDVSHELRVDRADAIKTTEHDHQVKRLELHHRHEFLSPVHSHKMQTEEIQKAYPHKHNVVVGGTTYQSLIPTIEEESKFGLTSREGGDVNYTEGARWVENYDTFSTGNATHDDDGPDAPVKGQIQTSQAKWSTAVQTDGDQLMADATCAKVTKVDGDVRVGLKRDNDAKDLPNWFISEPPVTEGALFYGDPKATTWEARHGTYQPIRIENHNMEDLHSGTASFYDLAAWGDTSITPELYGNSFIANVEGTGTWGVAYYRNINLATSVTVKSVQYTQGIVNPIGPFANLTPMTADPDPKAIALVTEESRRLAHAFPAKFNDLSEILGNIFGVAKKIGGTVKSIAGGLEGLPVVGEIASTVKSILGAIGL